MGTGQRLLVVSVLVQNGGNFRTSLTQRGANSFPRFELPLMLCQLKDAVSLAALFSEMMVVASLVMPLATFCRPKELAGLLAVFFSKMMESGFEKIISEWGLVANRLLQC